MTNHVFTKEVRDQLKSLKQSNNYRGFIGVSNDYLVIGLAIFLSLYSWWFYPLSLLMIGSRQRALATILHDASHNCLAKNKTLNYFLGTFLSGYLIGQEFNNYRQSHVKGHHAYLGDKDKDPDYQFHLDVGLYHFKNNNHFFWKYIIRPFFLLNIFSYLFYIFKHRMLQYKVAPKQYLIMIIYWLIIVAVFFKLSILNSLILFWVIPYITTFTIIGWFIELAEHYPLVQENNNSIKMTRNRFSHPLEAFFLSMHAENYHLTHHLMPSIPYWNIEKAHKIMMNDIVYKKLNLQMGGVFISSNGQIPIVKDLIHRKYSFLVQENKKIG